MHADDPDASNLSPGKRMTVAVRLNDVLCMVGTSTPVWANPNAMAGRAFARANCSRCHSIDKHTRSPLPVAPPFRTFHERYLVESLKEALGEGIVTGHSKMSEFRLDLGQVGGFHLLPQIAGALALAPDPGARARCWF